MEWHINDLSLAGQFNDPLSFRARLEPLLRLRSSDPYFRANFYSSRHLNERPVTATASLREVVLATRDKNFISLVLAWLGKSGPFWDDAREFNADDYFEHNGDDVTDQGLGEAARRKLVAISASTYSFTGFCRFERSPLSVQHGLSEAPIGLVEVDNDWTLERLESKLDGLRVVDNWGSLDEEIRRRFTGLIFPDNVLEGLRPTPFSRNVKSRIIELLDVLEKVVNETGDDGQLSKTGLELLAKHFAGEKAWFTDESRQNKIDFEIEMTFVDPVNPDQKIFCPWHGKIKTPQTRIHFEWPRPAGQKSIKALYIGPKITKR